MARLLQIREAEHRLQRQSGHSHQDNEQQDMDTDIRLLTEAEKKNIFDDEENRFEESVPK